MSIILNQIVQLLGDIIPDPMDNKKAKYRGSTVWKLVIIRKAIVRWL